MRAIGNMLIVMVIASMVSCAKTTPKKKQRVTPPSLSNMRMNFSPLKCQRDGFVIPPVGKG